MTKANQGLPIKGYQPQSDEAVALVNANKVTEEKLLRVMDELKGSDAIDQRWLAIARTNIEQGFMALNRAIFRPGRVDLDAAALPPSWHGVAVLACDGDGDEA